MDNNSKGSWIKNVPILLYKNFTEVPDVTYYLECRKTFVYKKTLQQIKNQGCLSKRVAVSVSLQKDLYIVFWVEESTVIEFTQNNLWGIAKTAWKEFYPGME